MFEPLKIFIFSIVFSSFRQKNLKFQQSFGLHYFSLKASRSITKKENSFIFSYSAIYKSLNLVLYILFKTSLWSILVEATSFFVFTIGLTLCRTTYTLLCHRTIKAPSPQDLVIQWQYDVEIFHDGWWLKWWCHPKMTSSFYLALKYTPKRKILTNADQGC